MTASRRLPALLPQHLPPPEHRDGRERVVVGTGRRVVWPCGGDVEARGETLEEARRVLAVWQRGCRLAGVGI